MWGDAEGKDEGVSYEGYFFSVKLVQGGPSAARASGKEGVESLKRKRMLNIRVAE